MALPTSKGELIEYALKELGKPVINIEMDEDQASDRVDYCLKKFVDRHYDGVTEVLFKKVVQKADSINGYLSIPDEITAILSILKPSSTWSIEPMESIEYYMMWDVVFGGATLGTMSNYYINMSHLALIDFILGKDHAFFFNSITKRLQLQYANSHVGSAYLLSDKIATDKWTKTNCVAVDNTLDDPLKKPNATEITSSAAGIFSVESKYETTQYVRGVYSTEVALQAGSYTGNINIIMEDGDGVELTRYANIPLTTQWVNHLLTGDFVYPASHDIVVRIETVDAALAAGETFGIDNPILYANAYIIVHGYKAIDVETFDNVWQQEWILKYTTALMKRQWGTNIKKYDGIQLPAGITMNGQQIYDEAQAEIDKLDEQFSMEYELPVDFMMG